MIDRQRIQKQFAIWTADDFRPSVLASSVLSSLLIYKLEIIFVISFAALVFSDRLTGQLPQTLGFILVGDAIGEKQGSYLEVLVSVASAASRIASITSCGCWS